jgi:ketosteroid isomerase-like protein
MSTFLRVSSIATATALALAAGRPAAAETVRDELLRQTQELLDAIAVGKTAVWEKYLDPGVRFVDETGAVHTKKEMLEDVRPLPEGVSGTIQATNFDSVVHGDTAVSTYVDDEHEIYHGQSLHCQYRTTQTWRRTPDGWRLIAAQVLALRTDPAAVTLPAATLDSYCGKYALTPSIAYEIRRKGDGLEGQQTGRKPEELRAEAPDVLFVPGRPRYRYLMQRNASGSVTRLLQRREAWDLEWKKEPAAR